MGPDLYETEPVWPDQIRRGWTLLHQHTATSVLADAETRLSHDGKRADVVIPTVLATIVCPPTRRLLRLRPKKEVR